MKVMQQDIGTGDESIFATLYEMKRLALRDSTSDVIKKIAKEILSTCNDNEECSIISGFDEVFDKVKYQFDHDIVGKYVKILGNPEHYEFITAPKYLLSKTFEGDCDDMSTALASLYIALNLPVNFKIIAWKSHSFTHVYTEVAIYHNNQYWWIPSDPVIKQFGREKAPVRRAYVLRVDVPDTKIEKVIGE